MIVNVNIVIPFLIQFRDIDLIIGMGFEQRMIDRFNVLFATTIAMEDSWISMSMNILPAIRRSIEFDMDFKILYTTKKKKKKRERNGGIRQREDEANAN
jgi:hypothetical protein